MAPTQAAPTDVAPAQLDGPAGDPTADGSPWALAALLEAGVPAEITAMADGWNLAAAEAAEATAAGRDGSQVTADGALVDGAPLHPEGEAAEQTARQLGLGGEEMQAVAGTLTTAATSLTDNTAAARRAIAALDAAIAAETAAANQGLADNAASANAQLATAFSSQQADAIISNARSAEQGIISGAQSAIDAAIEKARTEIQGYIETYEGVLGDGMRTLSGLGIDVGGAAAAGGIPAPSGDPAVSPLANAVAGLIRLPLFAGNLSANLGDIAGDAGTTLGLLSAGTDFVPVLGQAVDVAGVGLALGALAGHGIGDLLGADIPPETYRYDRAGLTAAALGAIPIPLVGAAATAGLVGAQGFEELAYGDDAQATIFDNLETYYQPENPQEAALAATPHGAGLLPLWNAVQEADRETEAQLPTEVLGGVVQGYGDRLGPSIDEGLRGLGQPITLPR